MNISSAGLYQYVKVTRNKAFTYQKVRRLLLWSIDISWWTVLFMQHDSLCCTNIAQGELNDILTMFDATSLKSLMPVLLNLQILDISLWNISRKAYQAVQIPMTLNVISAIATTSNLLPQKYDTFWAWIILTTRNSKISCNMMNSEVAIVTGKLYWFNITINKVYITYIVNDLSLIHIWRCRRIERCRSRWSPYH